MTVAIGSVIVDRQSPRIVASVGYEDCLESSRRAVKDGADIVEVRVDHFPGLDRSEGENAGIERVAGIKKACSAPLVLTARGRAEGGEYPGGEAARGELYVRLMPLADAVDVELRAKAVRARVVPEARRAGAPVILSLHDFSATPSDAQLEAAIEEGFKAGAAIVKLALTPQSLADVARLLALTERNSDRDIAVIAMGDLGKVSRLIFPRFGSRLTYAHAGRGVAPGQMSVAEVRSVLNMLR